MGQALHRKTITEHPKVLTDQVIAVLLESGANLEMLSDGIAKSNSFRYIDLLINNGFKIARKLACVAGGSSLELFHDSQPSITDYHIALYSAIVDRNYIRAFALLPHCGRPVCFRDLNHGPILLVSGGEPRLRGNVLKMALARRPDIPKDLFNIDPFDITEDHKRLFHLLIESGANINRANHRGSTPVLVATRNNDIDYLTELLRHGANPNTITETGNSPLLQAFVGRNALAYIDLLLSYGAKFDSESIRKGVFKRTKDFLETQLLPEEKLELEQAWRFIIEKSSHHGTSDNSC